MISYPASVPVNAFPSYVFLASFALSTSLRWKLATNVVDTNTFSLFFAWSATTSGVNTCSLLTSTPFTVQFTKLYPSFALAVEPAGVPVTGFTSS